MAVYRPFSSGLSASKNNSTHPIQAEIEHRVDQRRFSSAALERSDINIEGIQWDIISDEDDAKSIYETQLFNTLKLLFVDCSPRTYCKSFVNM